MADEAAAKRLHAHKDKKCSLSAQCCTACVGKVREIVATRLSNIVKKKQINATTATGNIKVQWIMLKSQWLNIYNKILVACFVNFVNLSFRFGFFLLYHKKGARVRRLHFDSDQLHPAISPTRMRLTRRRLEVCSLSNVWHFSHSAFSLCSSAGLVIWLV